MKKIACVRFKGADREANKSQELLMDSDLMTVDELSQLLKVKKSWIYRCSHEGRLPVVRISSRCIRFKRSEIDRWLRKKAFQPTHAEDAV